LVVARPETYENRNVQRELPTGTVTFLFTDIEGSTRLLQELGAEAYARELACHRAVVREAFAAEGGVEVDTQGDALFVAFPTAPGALRAAARATERLAAGRVRVRVGIHTGTPLVSERGYVGEDVHRAARIGGAGHGGQVLVSAATAALVGTDGLRDLGEHRFKDLSAPERVYQLGDGEFPPLRSLYQTNMPVSLTSFLGREGELAAVIELLDSDGVRLLTLTGAGGSGKTRLALQAAAAVSGGYGDGVWWVPLAPLRDAQLVLETARQALGARVELAEHIGDRSMLVLFDNFEHVIDAAGEVAALLGHCPHLDVLVTSREPLHVSGEYEYPVLPLAHEDAAELFVARAKAVVPGFESDAAVAEICRRVDALPLAVELAAARVKALSLSEIAKRLDRRLPLLVRGMQDVSNRQRTLRATIDWSYQLLAAEEQRLFARLAVFAGGSTLEAAERVVDADLDLLQLLVEKSLVRFGGDRYEMLETIHEFASELFGQLGEAGTLRRRHAEYFAGFAARLDVESRAMHGVERRMWAGRNSGDVNNLRRALDTAVWLADRELALRLVGLGPLVYATTVPDGLRLVETALGIEGRSTRRAEANALQRGGQLAFERAAGVRSRTLLQDSLEHFRILGDDEAVADTLADLAQTEATLGDIDGARSHLHESIELSRRIASDDRLAGALHSLGELERDHGRITEGAELLAEALELRNRAEDYRGAAQIRHGLADLRLEEGELRAAERLYAETLVHFRSEDDRRAMAYCLGGLAAAAAARGELTRAATLWAAVEEIEEERGAPLRSFERARYRRFLGALDATRFVREVEAAKNLELQQTVEFAIVGVRHRQP
jgi:predicted ATPase/class 3 adenylate cyclase